MRSRLARTVFDTLVLVVALLSLALLAPPSRSAPLPVQHDAWTGYCEGCDNGNVILDFDGENRAVVFGLTYDADVAAWVGQGSVDYVAQGLSIHDQAATFRVDLVDSPTKDDPYCHGASKMVSAVSILGAKAAYTVTTSNPAYTIAAHCAQGRYDFVFDDAPRAVGRLRKTFAVAKGYVVTPSGRLIRR